MPKKKITAHLRIAVLRVARELSFTVIQNTKTVSWQKTRDLRDTRPWGKKKEKNATVAVKLPLTEGTQNTAILIRSVFQISQQGWYPSQQGDKKLKSSVSATWGKGKCLLHFSVDTCFMTEHKTASNSWYQKAVASEILNYQRNLYSQHIQRIIFQWPNTWDPFTEPHMPFHAQEPFVKLHMRFM